MYFKVKFAKDITGESMHADAPQWVNGELIINGARYREDEWTQVTVFSETAPTNESPPKKKSGLYTIPTTRGEEPGPGYKE